MFDQRSQGMRLVGKNERAHHVIIIPITKIGLETPGVAMAIIVHHSSVYI